MISIRDYQASVSDTRAIVIDFHQTVWIRIRLQVRAQARLRIAKVTSATFYPSLETQNALRRLAVEAAISPIGQQAHLPSSACTFG